ncbi:MAG: acyl-CoA thioester hydrolase/BAAT C-terminal domain-containing protein [Candidatus Ventricola sp.]
MSNQREAFSVEKDGFFGAYYTNPNGSDRCMIALLGDDIDDHMARTGAKWLMKHGCNVMTMAPSKKDYGHHSYPLERFEKAIAVIRRKSNLKIGIVGASTTGMLALVAASYIHDISLTIAMSPCDFIMEGFVRDGKDGMKERPADGESTVTVGGKPLPYLPFAYRHPKYWQMIEKEAKEGGDMIASRRMFDESERLHPVREEERIRVENIRGRILFVGAEDDVLWDTCKYIRRMDARLKAVPHDSQYELALYPHGTHFVFPESMLRMMLPVGSGLLVGAAFSAGRQHPGECRAARVDIDNRVTSVLCDW